MSRFDRGAWGAGVTPSAFALRASGDPNVSGVAEMSGRCWLCGGAHERGADLVDWMPATFTTHTLARCPSSDTVCEACVYVTSRLSPVPGRPPKPGKKLGGNFRNYSHVGEGDRYANASKGEKPIIRDFLASEHAGPWFCAIADSGQKHVLPFARLNPPGSRWGWVRFEEADIWWDAEAAALLETIGDGLSAGITKGEVETGDYRPNTWTAVGFDRVRQFEEQCAPWRGGHKFALALWLAQREADDDETVGPWHTERAEGGGSRLSAGSPPRCAEGRTEPAQDVRPDDEPEPSCGGAVRVRGGVVLGGDAGVAGRVPVQLDLF